MTSLYKVLNISRQDMVMRLQDMDVVGNNLANISTTGFKASRTNFQEFLKEASLNGVTKSSTQILPQQGRILVTGNKLDLAIDGSGYFPVELADGSLGYTRDGQLFLDTDRNFVTASGFRLIWDGEIPENFEDIRFDGDGTVYYKVGDTWPVAGQLQLTRFPNAAGLVSAGDNMWKESPASGEAINGNPLDEGFGKLQLQSIEKSNVDMGKEMTHLMTLQRVFQLSTRAFQQTDTMISQAINMRRG
jgi:flagellar basal-body rod protein FlgG